jgi:hypothetical protein
MEIITVCSEMRVKHKNMVCGAEQEFVKVKYDGI